MLKPNLITEQYKIGKIKDNQWAKIYFVNGEFNQVEFKTKNFPYTLEDWMFFKKIIETIEQIIKEKE